MVLIDAKLFLLPHLPEPFFRSENKVRVHLLNWGKYEKAIFHFFHLIIGNSNSHSAICQRYFH